MNVTCRLFIFFFLVGFPLFLSAQIDFDQEVKIQNNVQRFDDLIASISDQTSILFSYSSNVVDPSTIISLEAKNYKLIEICELISARLNIGYLEFNQKILFVEQPPEWKEYWIYGYVRDETSGEPLIGAIIYNYTDNIGVETNSFGYFSLKVKTQNPKVAVSFLGYKTYEITKAMPPNNRLDINLVPKFLIPVIVVTPVDSIDNKFIMDDIFKSTTKNVNPSLFGEKDVQQSIKFLPGIQSGSEMQGNILVRGGGTDQNLILYDGVPIYEPNHLLGLTSMFNEDVVNDVDVHTSGFDSKHGGRLSSVMDVQIKNGNKFRQRLSLSVGLLGAKIHAEGPLKKGRTSYNASVRTSYINQLIRPIAQSTLGLEDTRFGYTDLNFKVHHKLTQNSSIAFGSYVGRDILGFNTRIRNEAAQINSLESNNRIGWSNRLFNVRFDQILNKKMFFNISASSVDYSLNTRSSNIYRRERNDGTLAIDEVDIFAYSQILDNNLKTDWEYKQSDDHAVSFGYGVSTHTYNPTVISEEFISTGATPNPTIGIRAIEQFLYLEDQYDVSEFLTFKTGFHLSQFTVEEETFNSFQPRVTVQVFLNPTNDISFNYSKMTQFVHLLVNPGTGLPSDLWLPSTRKIPPEHSQQYNLQYTRIWNKEFLTYVSAYYKGFENLIEYRSAFPLYNPVINGETVIPLFENPRDWEDRVEVGRGEAYGIDAFLAYNTSKWKNSLSYSLSYSNRQFENINQGRVFPFKYDRRHDFSLSSNYRFTDRWSAGLNWVYGSGAATTFSTTQFITIDGDIIFDNGERNAFRLKAYHRLDLNAEYRKPINEKLEMICSFGFYNSYNRLNPYFVYLFNDEQNGQFEARQVGLFPVLPFLNLKFQY